MIEKTGDLFTTSNTFLAHGVNTAGVMGAGIAKSFAARFPKMVPTYRKMCQDGLLTPGRVFTYVDPESGVTVYNAATQDLPGRHASLGWVVDAMCTVAAESVTAGHRTVSVPRIGCGIGGLDWDNVRMVLSLIEQEYEIEFEVWTL